MRSWIRRRLTLARLSLFTFLCVLVITLLTCAIGADVLTRHLVRHDAELVGDLVRLLLTESIPASYFTEAGPADPSPYVGTFVEIVASAAVVQVILYDATARVLWSDDATMIGRRFAGNPELDKALRGEIEAHIIRPSKEEHQGKLRAFQRVEEIYLPVRYAKDGPVVGVLEIYRHPPKFFEVLDRGLVLVWILGGGSGLLLYATVLATARLARDSTERKRREEALRRLNESLEGEVKRIAHELHDEAGQLLAAAYIALGDVEREAPPSVRERLHGLRGVLDQIEENLRQLTHELRPTILDHLGLGPAFELLAQGVARRTGLRITVEANVEARLPPLIETSLYRVVQVSLTNVVKHARASEVTIRVGQEAQGVRCEIRDNGVGFDVAAVLGRTGAQGLGLTGNIDHIEALGGTFHIASSPGEGTEVIITVPLEA